MAEPSTVLDIHVELFHEIYPSCLLSDRFLGLLQVRQGGMIRTNDGMVTQYVRAELLQPVDDGQLFLSRRTVGALRSRQGPTGITDDPQATILMLL